MIKFKGGKKKEKNLFDLFQLEKLPIVLSVNLIMYF